LSERLNQLDEQLKIIGRSIEIIWANQKELSKSEELLDEQFAVSTRMTISNFNELSARWNKALQYLLPSGDQPAEKVLPDTRKSLVQMLIGYSDVNKLFADWAEFRKRSDYREHMRPWFMGDDLSTLPPPPVPPVPERKEGVEYVGDSSIEVKKEGEANATSDPGNPSAEAQSETAPDRAEGAPAAVPEV
jgi:hypothetical protein